MSGCTTVEQLNERGSIRCGTLCRHWACLRRLQPGENVLGMGSNDKRSSVGLEIDVQTKASEVTTFCCVLPESVANSIDLRVGEIHRGMRKNLTHCSLQWGEAMRPPHREASGGGWVQLERTAYCLGQCG